MISINGEMYLSDNTPLRMLLVSADCLAAAFRCIGASLMRPVHNNSKAAA